MKLSRKQKNFIYPHFFLVSSLQHLTPLLPATGSTMSRETLPRITNPRLPLKNSGPRPLKPCASPASPEGPRILARIAQECAARGFRFAPAGELPAPLLNDPVRAL